MTTPACPKCGVTDREECFACRTGSHEPRPTATSAKQRLCEHLANNPASKDAKPSEKPEGVREWFASKEYLANCPDARSPIPEEIREKFSVHVVEHSAYLAAITERDEWKHKATFADERERLEFAAYAARLTKELAEYKHFYETTHATMELQKRELTAAQSRIAELQETRKGEKMELAVMLAAKDRKLRKAREGLRRIAEAIASAKYMRSIARETIEAIK